MEEKELEKLLETYGKKRIKYSKKIVFLVIMLNALFTIAIFYIYLKQGTEPTTLIDRWFQFTGIELGSLAGIKVVDTITERRVEK